MRRLKTIGLTLLALFALGAFAASMASAEEGVLQKSEAKNFTGEGGEAKLETTKKENIKCPKVLILEGKFLVKPEPFPDQHGTAKLQFEGCKAEGLAPANSLGDKEGIILQSVLFRICLVEPTKLVFGMVITPTESTVHVEVPVVAELVLVKGSVIAELEGAGLKGKEFKFKLEGKEGKQEVAKECKIGTETFKHSFEAANDSKGKTDVAASEKAKFTIKFENEVEFMDT